MRSELGPDVHLLHDVHHRLTPIEAARLGHALEPFHLFWLEDPTPAENQESFRLIRHHTTTPLAVGEVFNSIHDCRQLIQEQLIDYIRMTVVHAGGISHLRKIASLAELYQVRTGSHGATDLSPVCMAAALHFDLSVHNFGIQEYMPHSAETDACFRMPTRSPTAACIRATRQVWASRSTRRWRRCFRTNRHIFRWHAWWTERCTTGSREGSSAALPRTDSDTQSLTAIVIEIERGERPCRIRVIAGLRSGPSTLRDPRTVCYRARVLRNATSSPLMWVETLDLMMAKLAGSGVDLSRLAAVSGSGAATRQRVPQCHMDKMLEIRQHLTDLLHPPDPR